ncbi:MAG TPA: hypothetical protein VJU86_01355 [Pyrinomonadaceae bacterium]|nr:hypothetical protein [Pyrinomonadaceae bacterium]
MKKVLSSFFMVLMLFVSYGNAIAQPSPSDDGFSSFYAAFKKAVLKGNRTVIRNMMSARFDWALDGYISRDEAIGHMDEMKLWRGLRNAVTRKPVRCCSNCCHLRAGYYLDSSPKFPARYAIEIMFERGADGRWLWSGVLGD